MDTLRAVEETGMDTAAYIIREIDIADAGAAAQLSGELGYPVAISAMQERIGALTGSKQVVYVACRADTVVGWVDAGVVHHLQTGAYGEIGGLIVSPSCRNEGIGRELVRRAEQWMKDQGLTTVVVRSRVERKDAHRFYLQQGYRMTKTSAVFSKPLL